MNSWYTIALRQQQKQFDYLATNNQPLIETQQQSTVVGLPLSTIARNCVNPNLNLSSRRQPIYISSTTNSLHHDDNNIKLFQSIASDNISLFRSRYSIRDNNQSAGRFPQGPAVVGIHDWPSQSQIGDEFTSSIRRKKSRSRSPIISIARPFTLEPIKQKSIARIMSQDKYNEQAEPERRAMNPFRTTSTHGSNLGADSPSHLTDNQHHPMLPTRRLNNIDGVNHPMLQTVEPLIYPDSFERRRSIYESAPASHRDAGQEFVKANGSDHYESNESPQSTGGPQVRATDEDSMSLDEILAQIEAGRIPVIDINACDSMPTIDKGFNAYNQIELHEISGTNEVVVPARDSLRNCSSLNGFDPDLIAQPPIETSKISSASMSALDRNHNHQHRTNNNDQLLTKLDHVESESSDSNSSSASTTTTANKSIVQLDDSKKKQRRRSKGAKAELDDEEMKKKHEIISGYEIAWLDFTYSVEPNIFEDPRWGKVNKLFHKERRMILKGLSGGCKSSQMVALMGPSGAGKTCLLESIAGLRTSGIGGRMCLRGRKRAQLVIVPQYDDFMPQFTVEETVIYGSRMKNPYETNHLQVADKVIEQLGLEVCRANNIHKCSGGQKKRVAIAQELVSRPNILILDEPTSGLDSSCCYHTMSVLRDVIDKSAQTDEPMTIISTIHQPSAKVFKMFDLVYLLGKTGYMAYSGPPDELISTIRNITGLECPQYSNPSDFMIELVAYDYGEEPVEKLIEFERQKAQQFARDFEKRAGLKSSVSSVQQTTTVASKITVGQSSKLGDNRSATTIAGSISSNHNQLSIAQLTPSKNETQLSGQTKSDQMKQKSLDLLTTISHVKYKRNVTVPLQLATDTNNREHPFLWHTWVHLHRSFLQAIRDPILNNMRILIHLVFAFLLVMLYGKKSGEARGCPPVLGLPTEITDPNNESMIDLADNVGYLFMCIMMITYVSLMSTVLTFPIDIKTVGREYKNGWYGTVTYFLGKTIADLPFIILYPIAYCSIVWYMTDQAQDHMWRYFSFNVLIIMNAMNSQSFGLILGALFVNSVTAATFLGPVITIPWYLFTGFTKRVHRLAEPFKSTSKFLFTRYIFEGILDTVYGHQRCNCSAFLRQYHQLRFEEANRLGQLISMETLSSLDYYDGLDTVADVHNGTTMLSTQNATTNWFEKTFDAASTVFADGDNLNLASLMDSNVKASSLFSFGLDFEPTCPSDYESLIVQDFRLGEDNVQKAYVIVSGMLVLIRIITFVLVAWKIRTRQL